MKQIAPEQLKQSMDAGNAPLLLDVRESWEYAICHIADSININMAQIPSRLHDLNPEREIIVICHHGWRSLQVASYLESNGFDNISNLLGGIDAWAVTVDPSLPRY